MSKKIMILGASILQLPAIQQAKKMGLKVVAVDMNPNAIGFKEDEIIKEVISTIDIPAIVDAAKRNNVDGVLTLASDMPMRSVAAVAKEMGLVGISDGTALKATNKAEMRRALFENGVPIPRYLKVSSREEYDKATEQFHVPFIVKPADNSGSRGIFKIGYWKDKKTISDAFDYCREYSRNGDMVVEEYMNGPEVSVETLSVDGDCHVIQITDKLTTGSPHFVEIGHSQPTRLSEETADRIRKIAKSANKAIGITNGPSHTEVIVTEEGPKIVEIGARLGGDCITTHLVPLSTGVNMVECCIRIALGEKPDIEPKCSRGSAIRYFHQHAGIIKSIEGLEEAAEIHGIQQISVVHGAGEKITEITESGARMGFVIALGDDASAAISKAEYALSKIKVSID